MSDELRAWLEFPQPEKGEIWRHKRNGMLVQVYRADASGVSVIRSNGYMTLYDPQGFQEQFELEAETDEPALRASATRPVTIAVRPEVAAFAEAMERKLSANDHKSHWRDMSAAYLLTRLFDEFLELQEAVEDGVPERIRDEAVDVADFAMMIWDVAGEGSDDGE